MEEETRYERFSRQAKKRDLGFRVGRLEIGSQDRSYRAISARREDPLLNRNRRTGGDAMLAAQTPILFDHPSAIGPGSLVILTRLPSHFSHLRHAPGKTTRAALQKSGPQPKAQPSDPDKPYSAIL